MGTSPLWDFSAPAAREELAALMRWLRSDSGRSAVLDEALEAAARPVSETVATAAATGPDYGAARPYAEALERLGHEVFRSSGGRDLNLNIVGVRKSGAKVDEWGGEIAVFWEEPSGRWRTLSWQATTYPGSHYLVRRLLNPRGAAILVPGQYRGVYRLDTHNGKYRALCQRLGPVRVYRDGNRDRVFDLDPSTRMEGMFGINIHAPVTPSAGTKAFVASAVGNASAGCQVFRSVSDFLEFRSLCEAAAKVWGNRFTYTLIRDLDMRGSDRAPAPESYDDLDWEMGVDTAGSRNRNPLNVKGDGWRYSLGTDSRGHHRFPCHAKGLRAGIVTLRSYRTRHGLDRIATILARWAPASDTVGSIPGAPKNSPAAYSRFVAARMGAVPMERLRCFEEDGTLSDLDQLYSLTAAMCSYENGAGVELPRWVFDRAVGLL